MYWQSEPNIEGQGSHFLMRFLSRNEKYEIKGAFFFVIILAIPIPVKEWTEYTEFQSAFFCDYSGVHSEDGIAPKRTRIPAIPSIPVPE